MRARPPANLHATALVIGTRGVLITGASGAGKSRLANTLHMQCHRFGIPSLLVSDDQVLPEKCEDRLLVRAPASIQGLIEIRGFGPAAVPHLPAAVMDLVVELVAAEHAERLPDQDAKSIICGVAVPKLTLARHDADGSALAILARLGWSLWSEQPSA